MFCRPSSYTVDQGRSFGYVHAIRLFREKEGSSNRYRHTHTHTSRNKTNAFRVHVAGAPNSRQIMRTRMRAAPAPHARHVMRRIRMRTRVHVYLGRTRIVPCVGRSRGNQPRLNVCHVLGRVNVAACHVGCSPYRLEPSIVNSECDTCAARAHSMSPPFACGHKLADICAQKPRWKSGNFMEQDGISWPFIITSITFGCSNE